MWVLTIDGNLVNLADAEHIHIQQTEGSGNYSVVAEFPGGRSVSLGEVGSQERAQHLYNVIGSRLGAINLMQAGREGGRLRGARKEGVTGANEIELADRLENLDATRQVKQDTLPLYAHTKEG